MGVLNEAAVIGAELERVAPLVEGLYEVDDTFYSTIDKESNIERISGRDMRIPLKLRPGGYFRQYNPDGGPLGRGGAPFFDKAVINTIPFAFACEWTKKAEWGTDDTRKAVVNAFRDIVASAMPQFRHDSDAMCMTAGNGILGVASAVSTAAGVDTVTLGTDGFGAMLLRSGLKVNIYDTTLATQRTIAVQPEITFYDIPNKTIKLTPATAGFVATDVIVIDGVSGASPVSLFGVPYHNNGSSVGTWLGFDRATTPEIRSSRVAAGGALAVSQPRLALNKLLDRIGMAAAKRLKLKAWMNPAQMAAYEGLGYLVSIIQKTTRDEGLNLFFGEDMQMAGAAVKTSIHWDKKRIDFLADSFWGRAEMKSPGFYEVGGRKFFEVRDPSGGVATSQLFYLVASWNLFLKNPASASYIDTLTVPTGY